MDKVLTRKLFRDTYLKSLDKNIFNFNKGGLASLRIHHFDEGGSASSLGIDPTILNRLMQEYGAPYTEGQQQAMLLAPIASSLLTGTRMPGQSQLGAVASNVGAALPQVAATSIQMKKLEDERLSAIAKASTVNLGKGTVRPLTEKELLDNNYQKGDKILANFDPLRPDRITGIVKEDKQEDRIQKIKQDVNSLKLAGSINNLDIVENALSPYVQDGKVVKDIPGLGQIGRYSLSEDARNMKSIVSSLTNIQLKDQSGATVTNPEFERYKEQIAAGKFNSDQDFVNTVQRMRDIINAHLGQQLTGHQKTDIDAYIAGGGIGPKASPLKAAPINYAPNAKTYKITKSGNLELIK
jgi:hypothetical protein